MTNREIFIDEVEELLFEQHKTFSMEAQEFWEHFKAGIDVNPTLTENGKLILTYLKEYPNDAMTAKEIGEHIDLSGRSVAGSMKKLVSDGYCEKTTGNPVLYKITLNGLELI